MPRKKGMKLDQALKLYIALYFLCFGLTWMISVPMLIHVTPESECLLFVSPYVKYGPSAACNFVGFAPIAVALATAVLIVLHMMQLRSLKSFLRQPGPHQSSNYHQRPTHIFWRLVMFHGIVTLGVLVIASIVTAGYVTSCENLYQLTRNTVRKRVDLEKFGGGNARQESYDVFADDRSINRYTGNYRDSYGQNAYEHQITCRNILTDPEYHRKLRENHAKDPNYSRALYGNFYIGDQYADVGDIRYLTYRNNTILEMAIAGSWISFAIWLIILILMIKERHHIKAHLTDESMWGSEFGGASRRSMGSRMSNQSFDKQSRYSNQSGSRYSRSRHYDPNGSYVKQPGVEPPLATSQLASTILPPSNQANQSSLMNYFGGGMKQPEDEVVDVDAAINDHPDLDNPIQMQMQMQDHPDSSYFDVPEDNSFESNFPIPVAMDQSDGHDPLPLGDEVSMGVISRDSENMSRNEMNQHSQPMPMPNPNRVQGRRGGRRSAGPLH
eukprot:01728.XXX_6355_9210_1 [CDS] Oithona nana genome sequencing.